MINREQFKVVGHEKHYYDVNTLSKELSAAKEINSSTILIAMSPENTQPMSNFLRHKLSFLNKDEVIDECSLNFPTIVQSQVFDEQEQEYMPFEAHLQMFVNRSILSVHSYIFLISHIHPGNEKLIQRAILASKTKTESIKVATLYLHENASYIPDYYVEKYKGTLIYEWQNSNNPIYSTNSSKNRGLS